MDFYLLPVIVILLDLLLGEPPNAWHPVAWFGHAAAGIEKICRKIFGSGIFSGSAAWLIMTVIPGTMAFLLVRLALRIHLYSGWAAAVLLIFFCVALRSLLDHSRRIRKPLMDAGSASSWGKEAVSSAMSPARTWKSPSYRQVHRSTHARKPLKTASAKSS